MDGLLAQAVMSLQAVKAVEIGRGVTAAESLGSQCTTPSATKRGRRFTKFSREQNNAGGIEGGISNGEDIVVRGYLKPISTLRRPLGFGQLRNPRATKAAYERSDVCVVPAAGVAAEAMVALTVARCVIEKFGGDSSARVAAQLQRLLRTDSKVLNMPTDTKPDTSAEAKRAARQATRDAVAKLSEEAA
jgi:chorismate synthase